MIRYLDYIFYRFYTWYQKRKVDSPLLSGITAVFAHAICLSAPMITNVTLISKTIGVSKWLVGIPLLLILCWRYYKHKDEILAKYRDSKFNRIPNYLLIVQFFVLMAISTAVSVLIREWLKKYGYTGFDDMIYKLCFQ